VCACVRVCDAITRNERSVAPAETPCAATTRQQLQDFQQHPRAHSAQQRPSNEREHQRRTRSIGGLEKHSVVFLGRDVCLRIKILTLSHYIHTPESVSGQLGTRSCTHISLKKRALDCGRGVRRRLVKSSVCAHRLTNEGVRVQEVCWDRMLLVWGLHEYTHPRITSSSKVPWPHVRAQSTATRVLNKYKTADRGQAHTELAHEWSYATAGTPPPPPHRVRGEAQMQITLQHCSQPAHNRA
jgi:hypothetical protein